MAAGAIIGGIGSLLGGAASLAGLAGKGGKSSYNRAIALLQRVQSPDFNFSKVTPRDLAVVAEFFPNVYEAVVPQEVKLAQDSPEVRDAQARGLAHLERVTREGLPLGERLAAQAMGRELASEAGRIDRGIIEDLRRRGRAGGGTEIAARMAGSQNASEAASQIGSQLARDAVMNRLRAASESGRLAGAMRGQDLALSQSNANSVNRFNEWVSALLTRRNEDAARSRERAQAYNVGLRQSQADRNVANRQGLEERGLDRENQLRQALADFQLRRAGGAAGAQQAYGQAQYDEQAARARQLAGMGRGFGTAVGGLIDATREQPTAPDQLEQHLMNRWNNRPVPSLRTEYDWESNPYDWNNWLRAG